MSQKFRKMLQLFYCKINTTPHLDLYKKILRNQFDQVQVQPIHILTLKQQPTFNQATPRKSKSRIRQRQNLYKNFDFASVFLFGLMLAILKKPQNKFLSQIQDQTNMNVKLFYSQKLTQEATRYTKFFKGFFQFFHYVIARQYKTSQVQQLLKTFYNSSIEKKGLKKAEKQKYGTEAQTILSFILGFRGTFPSKKQLMQPTSDPYELNNLNFCINIQNNNENEQWTIGQGENQINIIKQKNQYFILEQQIIEQESQEEILTDTWLKILEQSQKIKQEQSAMTSKLFLDLNITPECRSPTKSVRSPISANINSIRRPKKNFI